MSEEPEHMPTVINMLLFWSNTEPDWAKVYTSFGEQQTDQLRREWRCMHE